MTGDFLFIHYGFNGDEHAPNLVLHKDGDEQFESLLPRGKTLTLSFDTAQRYCGGWHDLATAESFPCPDQVALPAQYDHCRHCQNKTGFNPAFYHATSVSPQQQARNAQPHSLYLAHFAPGVVKVGISWSERGLRRLLDQGARSCLIIKQFPSAGVARQYEAKAAALPGIAETLQVKAKHKLLTTAYDAQAGAAELLAARDRLRAETGVTPDDHSPIFLDPLYFGEHTFTPSNLAMVDQPKISGRCIGILGSTLITEQDGQLFGLGLTPYTGYRVRISPNEEANTLVPQQASLF